MSVINHAVLKRPFVLKWRYAGKCEGDPQVSSFLSSCGYSGQENFIFLNKPKINSGGIVHSDRFNTPLAKNSQTILIFCKRGITID